MIDIDDTHAVMDATTFETLREPPTARLKGETMWKARMKGKWWLVFLVDGEKDFREILVAERAAA